ncbi:hypothetical protein CO151_02910 [bacterium CG_4_9_14_3_um_filter_65_15]|nr:MAG: hypothetical protein CO151_02910 [bacterium CG_4_9_14_3_um_filter_65_15]
MPALEFIRTTLLDTRSPACWWRHPVQATRVVLAAGENAVLGAAARTGLGEARECSVCGWRGLRFRAFLSADEVLRDCICPGCGSFDRHRQLVLGVRKELKAQPSRLPETMLGFSLSSAMRFLLEHEGLSRCYRTDFAAADRRFQPDFVTDLRGASLADGSVDWIFCSHVLEHIPELDICVDEIQRVLKPGGLAWIQVPFEPGLAHSKSIRIDPYRAHAHAWQFAPDFGNLLEREQWEVTEVIAGREISSSDLKRFGIDHRERYWVCRKGDA